MSVVSIDLASRRYRDIGIAVLRGTPRDVRVELVQPHERGLKGIPDVHELVRLCTQLALDAAADLILIDGPQGWRASTSEFVHMRVCERCTRTPGKTGVPEVVKPASWTRMARFSIELFDALEIAGWPRFAGSWPVARAAVETFPTHAWRSLGLESLPGKNRKGTDLDAWARVLSATFGLEWARRPTHDELQAVVAGVGGLMLQHSDLPTCDLHGKAPFQEEGSWREGYILSPKRIAEGWPVRTAAVAAPADSICFCARRR